MLYLKSLQVLLCLCVRFSSLLLASYVKSSCMPLDELFQSLLTSSLHPINLIAILEHDEGRHVFDLVVLSNQVPLVHIDEIKLHVGELHRKGIICRSHTLAWGLVGGEIHNDRCVPC